MTPQRVAEYSGCLEVDNFAIWYLSDHRAMSDMFVI